MKVETRLFGTIDVEDERIITFENGMIGFSDLKKYTLIYDQDTDGKSPISWLQSMEEPNLAFPVVDPLLVEETYNPVVEDEMLKKLGDDSMEDILVLVTITVPKDPKEMTVNLKAPIIIHAGTKKGMQIIVEDKYEVKHKIYHKLVKKDGECAC